MKDQRRPDDPWWLRLAWHPLAFPVALLGPFVILLPILLLLGKL